MAPRGRRRLPDLCVIALLQQMPLNDQLKAGRVNQRWTALLRAANRRVCSLTISCNKRYKKNDDFFESHINSFAIAYHSRSFQMLTRKEPLYPIRRLTKWNCLNVQFFSKKEENKKNVLLVNQIADAFSAITELTFATDWASDFEHLVEMFEQNHQWTGQLISFTLIDNCLHGKLSPSLKDRLFAAINIGMPLLQRLAIMWEGCALKVINDLSVIAQLKVFSAFCNKLYFRSLFPSLERYAGKAVDLKIILRYNSCIVQADELSEDVRNRIVLLSSKSKYEFYFLFSLNPDKLLFFCKTFPSLVSFKLIEPSFLLEKFTALAQLNKLEHIDLSLYPNSDKNFIYNELTRPKAVLHSVRALDLELTIFDHYHFQVEWFNLSRTLPNLEAIHLKYFYCESCKIGLDQLEGIEKEKLASALQCLRNVLPQIHSFISMSQILLDRPNFRTAEEVFSRNEE